VAIDQNTFDLSVKNPNAPIEPPLRHTQEILAEMKILDTESAEIIKAIKELIVDFDFSPDQCEIS
jgi:type I restriction enzyme M protein